MISTPIIVSIIAAVELALFAVAVSVLIKFGRVYKWSWKFWKKVLLMGRCPNCKCFQLLLKFRDENGQRVKPLFVWHYKPGMYTFCLRCDHQISIFKRPARDPNACVECGEPTDKNALTFGEHKVCPNCKELHLQRIREGAVEE